MDIKKVKLETINDYKETDLSAEEMAETYFKSHSEIISYEQIEGLTKLLFEESNTTNLACIKTTYFENVLIPEIEKHLMNAKKPLGIKQIISELELPKDLRYLITRNLPRYSSHHDNNIVTIFVGHMQTNAFLYNPECAEATKKGTEKRKWRCYDHMCGTDACRKNRK